MLARFFWLWDQFTISWLWWDWAPSPASAPDPSPESAPSPASDPSLKVWNFWHLHCWRGLFPQGWREFLAMVQLSWGDFRCIHVTSGKSYNLVDILSWLFIQTKFILELVPIEKKMHYIPMFIHIIYYHQQELKFVVQTNNTWATYASLTLSNAAHQIMMVIVINAKCLWHLSASEQLGYFLNITGNVIQEFFTRNKQNVSYFVICNLVCMIICRHI